MVWCFYRQIFLSPRKTSHCSSKHAGGPRASRSETLLRESQRSVEALANMPPAVHYTTAEKKPCSKNKAFILMFSNGHAGNQEARGCGQVFTSLFKSRTSLCRNCRCEYVCAHSFPLCIIGTQLDDDEASEKFLRKKASQNWIRDELKEYVLVMSQVIGSVSLVMIYMPNAQQFPVSCAAMFTESSERRKPKKILTVMVRPVCWVES